MIIRKATIDDVEPIAQSYTDLLLYEQEHGTYTKWEMNVYPTESYARSKVERGEMYVLEDSDEICASMILNQEQAAEYRDIPWHFHAEDDKVMVIHTLCIPPQKSKRGYGTKMVQFAKEFAKDAGCEVIRIDTNVINTPAKILYPKNGFLIAGEHHALHHGVINTTLVYLDCKL